VTGVTLADGRYGRVALRWRDCEEGWRLLGIALPPHSSEALPCGSSREAERLLDELLDPRRRAQARWALAHADFGGLSAFAQRVLRVLAEHVGPGRYIAYGELADLAGAPGAARAVGSVMRRNPFPLLVPCHRVLAAGGRIGGFQGGRDGGVAFKRALLAEEGVRL